MLALFALAAGLAVWWSRTQPDDAGEPTVTPAPEALWQLTPQQVLEVKVEGFEQGTTIHARRDEQQGWILLEPEDEDLIADPGRIERAVSGLVVLRPVEVLENVSLPEYRLDEPLYRATLTLQDGSTRSLLIGRQAPTGDVSYVRRSEDDSTVYLLQSFAVGEVTGLITVPSVVTATPGAQPSLTPEAD